MAKEAKTNAMRMLDRQKVKYEAFTYECDAVSYTHLCLYAIGRIFWPYMYMSRVRMEQRNLHWMHPVRMNLRRFLPR